MKNILRMVGLSALGLFLGINLYMVNATHLLGNQLPMPFGYGVAVVLSGSMEPTMSVDDMILIEEKDSYEVGDIVVYQSNGSLVVHRIIDINEDMITTKGDANNVADGAIHERYIKGEVISVIPGIGMIINIVKTPVVTVLLLIGAFALMEMSFHQKKENDLEELEKIREEIRKLKEEN